MLERESWPLSDEQAARLIDALVAAGDRRAAAEMFHAFDRRVASPARKRLALAAYERALWARPDASASNLPPARTPLVGRAEELASATSALSQRRALQLVGPGGIGKSRLALEIARVFGEHEHQTICWLHIAENASVEELAAAAARAVRLPEIAASLEGFCDALADGAALLVLDSCENSMQPAQTFGARVLERCGAARVLLTTRSAGTMFAGYPAIGLGPLSAKTASASEPAVRLFAERAMMANPHFALTPENARHVISICEVLDGVPLAIEVACGYLAHVGVGELAQRLRRGAANDLTDIVGQTLSWRLQLLPEADRETFLRIAIFDGDFSLADAQALTGAGSCEQALERLAAAFLLVRESSSLALRYRLLDPVRAFARALLPASQAQRLRAQFVAYAANLGVVSNDRVGPLAPGLLTALRFAAASGDLENGLQIIANCGIALGLGGFASLALRRVDELIRLPDAALFDAYDDALGAWSWLLSRCGRPGEAVKVNDGRIERARQSGSLPRLCAALATSVIAARNVGDFARAQAYGEEAAALARTCGDTRNLAKALRGLASVLMLQGRKEQAAALFEELFALGEDAVGATEYTVALHDYATTLRELGRGGEAVPLLRSCVARATQASDYACAIHAQATLARLSSDAGEIGEAHALLRTTLPLCRGDVNPLTRMYAFEDLVAASFKEGQYEALAFVLGYIDRTRERAQFKTGGPQAEYIAQIRSAARSHLDTRAYQASYDRGRLATLEDAFVRLEALQPGTVTLERAERLAPLSAREREVARLAAQGRTNREIAQALIVSVRTIDAHMAAIFRKLGIERREQLLR